MDIKEFTNKNRIPLIGGGVWLFVLLMGTSVGSDTVQTCCLILLLLSLLGLGCYAVFKIMRAIH